MKLKATQDEFLTPFEAALRLRRSVRTLARMRAEGRGPRFHREGGCILYPATGLYEWLEQFMVAPVRGAT
ncbi:helix-turn-helix domain-containing protein [Pontixanthobacter gangjinensis]|uniref:helix-turn-helix domain-containing protein n=1 Tax=Pontixanthobacter gangjinensis TaxID=1028742 RepID=UPI0038B683D6